MAVLTDTKARAMKPGEKPIPHGGVTGLRLIPGKERGRGKWELRFTSPVSGKRRDAGLGVYPDVGIAAAREKADAMRKNIAAGMDPLEAKKSDPKIPTFREAAETLHAALRPGWTNAKHSADWINSVTAYAIPAIGDLTVDALKPKHIADVLRPIWTEKVETASRLKQRLHAIMAWAWAHGYVEANPVDVVEHLLPKQNTTVEHQPAMPLAEVPKFIAAHLSDEHANVSSNALKFLILTAARSGEVRGAVWSEIDFINATWTIPAARMKAGALHKVPLSGAALAILASQRGQHDTLIFPSPRSKSIISDMTLTAFLRRRNAASGTAGRTATAHGFRSSFRDWCSLQGYSRDLAERALAHVVANKVEAAYHRTDLLEQRRPMMQAWADFVAGTEQQSNVVQIRSAA